MINLTHSASLFFTVAGTIVFLIMLMVRHDLKMALSFALDFWMGAGLLKLSGMPAWNVIGTLAAIVILRKLVTLRFNFI
jgi:uncharacterized membrane protein